MASVQELLLAAQSKAPRSKIAPLLDLLDTGISGYQTGQGIRDKNVDIAYKLLQKQQAEQDMQQQAEMQKQIQEQLAQQEQATTNAVKSTGPEATAAFPQMRMEQKISQDSKGRYSRSFEMKEPKLQTFAPREYVDEKGTKRIGKWSDTQGLIRSADDATADTPGSRNEMNKASFDLRKEFIDRPEVKEFVAVNTQVKSMDSMLSNAVKGNLKSALALDQSLITMYNKLNDPTSVVRESEYARTPENIPMVNRISGAISKLEQGGAGLTNEDREALVIGAKVIANERGREFNRARTGYETLSSQYQIDPSMVTGTLPAFSSYDVALSSSPRLKVTGFKVTK